MIRTEHEGVGLSKTWFETAEKLGIEIRYDTGAQRLTQAESGRVTGVVARGPDGFVTLGAKAVVLACGGFETNPEWRLRYLGAPWDHAKVRGSNFNYGDGLKMALDIGAMPWGHWSGCHATPINAEAADYGVQNLTDKTNRLSYFLGVMINVEGRRWVDEGADINSFTYAKYGGMILKQTAQPRLPDLRQQGAGPARAALLDERAVQVGHARRAGEAAARWTTSRR